MRLPFLLTAFGLPHTMGYLPTTAGEIHPTPLSLVGLMDTASELHLAGVEAPLPRPVDPAIIKDALQQRGLRIIPDWGHLLDTPADEFRSFIQTAAALDAPVVRVTLSSILCGDRRLLSVPWEAHLAAIAERLQQHLPLAGDMGLAIAVENHQDATSDDLLRLAEMVHHHPAFGITLDTGNPLAVGEDPVEYARRAASLIRHIHLKDYTLHFAPEGYRLVRCAAGDGVIDFPAILKVVEENGRALLPGIEIAAQATRTIPLLDPAWWDHYPQPHASHLIPALKLLWQKGRSAELPYSSAWERGEASGTITTEEWDVVYRSVQYFRDRVAPQLVPP